VEVLLSNLAALKLALDEDLLERFSLVAEDSAAYWETRAALAWN
jgi:hypothetical protein